MQKLTSVLVLTVALIGCSLSADTPKIIKLSDNEQKVSRSIAERRQDIAFRRQKATNDFQTQMNRLAEEEGELNLESAKLCFEMKKAHALDPRSQYNLDEWKGQLVKQ